MPSNSDGADVTSDLCCVKGTLCKKTSMVQRRFVAFVSLRLVLFGGFRGDVGAVHQVFKSSRLTNTDAKYRCGIRPTRMALEQLTLNQRVQGSSPCAPTSNLKYLVRY